MDIKRVGSRAEVWHGNAMMTSGGLKKKELMKNKHGRIVSAKKHRTAKKERRLVKAGYKTEKGVFGAKKTVKKGGIGIDIGIAEAKLGKNSGLRVGTKKHNIQANVGVDGVNVNALNLASSSLNTKGLKGRVGTEKHNFNTNVGVDGIGVNALDLLSASVDSKGLRTGIGHEKFFKADGSLTKEGLKASIGNKRIFKADGSLTKAGLNASIGNEKIFKADGSLTKAGLKASMGNKKLLNVDASASLSGIEVGADHLIGRTGVKVGSQSDEKRKSKSKSKKRGISVGPLSARITGGKKKKTKKKGGRRK